jgi:predicted ATPase
VDGQEPLEVIQGLVRESNSRNVLLICTYRDDHLKGTDIGQTFHHLQADSWTQAVHEMTVTNLAEVDVAALLSGTLGVVDTEAVTSLAHLCFSRTLGNSFFLTQFFSVLEQDGFFTPEEVEGNENLPWRWELREIQSYTIAADNVLSILQSRMAGAARSCNIGAQGCFFSCLKVPKRTA